jgi:hypothetical protein
MDITNDCAFQMHDITVWPGNPGRQVAPGSQILHHELFDPQGQQISSGDAHFPDAVLSPGEYAIVTLMEISRHPGEGYRLLLQVNPSIGGKQTELRLNVDEQRNWQKAF